MPADLSTPDYDQFPDAPRVSTWIAFVSNRAGSFDLYLTHADGTDLHAIAQSPSRELTPCWSPDGKKLAFTSDRTGMFQLYTVDIDTDVVTPIVTGLATAGAPAWSPDGNTIVFTGPDRLYLVPATAPGAAVALTDGAFRDTSAAWAADGSVIYFASDRSGAFDVWSIHPDGTGLQQVTTGTGIIGSPAPSPDGKTLALSSGATQVVFWSLAGATMQTFSAMDDFAPSFSPAGNRIVMTTVRYAADNPEIVLVDVADPNSLFRLTNDPGVDGQASFQPGL